MGPRTDIVDFYDHKWRVMREWAVFSNFYDQSNCPFDFDVPLAFCACELSDSDRVVCCEFSEKAVMLCKAAAMGDVETYGEIAKAKSPDVAKRLGRQVVGFDDDIWASIVCSVAFHVVHQKFAKTPQLRKLLLQGLNGEDQPTLFAEMTERDAIWGTGMDRQDRRAKNPSNWPGTNILGWALTEARDLLLVGKGVEYFAPLLVMQEAEILDDMPRELAETLRRELGSTAGDSTGAVTKAGFAPPQRLPPGASAADLKPANGPLTNSRNARRKKAKEKAANSATDGHQEVDGDESSVPPAASTPVEPKANRAQPPQPASETAKAAPAGENAEIEKKVRALRKKMRDIEKLKEKPAQSLDVLQREKIAGEPEIIRQIQELGFEP